MLKNGSFLTFWTLAIIFLFSAESRTTDRNDEIENDYFTDPEEIEEVFPTNLARNYLNVNLPKFRSNNKFFWRPTRSTPTQESDLATFFLRPTKSNKNFFLMRPMKRNQNQNQDSNPENYHHRYLRTNIQNPFWMRPTRSTVI